MDVVLGSLLTVSAMGVPVAFWLFLAAVTLVSVTAAVMLVGRPAPVDQRR